ncbi:LutB/LldF family L-lactate oxidation iron-sulfur protein [uncultured Cohaesibacter sp.]|uniref:LutB/LldF family L-lactate oxidation iron-sulfur protein n=1 Tax=uncultured Cohaesibacter sp. TaxID=1002546 RepID=UPI0029305226|nr:LutB/LldF family L-lactate oxidation iron-sulfur protein [uncultured Cohaesibacter sp.]
MKVTSPTFPENARKALRDETLQRALKNVEIGFIGKRQAAADALPEFEALRDLGRDIKTHTLGRLDVYLEEYEKQVTATGGHVHWAETGEDACELVREICRSVGARTLTKGKSMISEEMQLNAFLEKDGLEVTETDLGEYIVQLRGEHPSHIIAPAVHVTKEQVEADFRSKHKGLDPLRNLDAPESLLGEARQILREKYFAADVGITGANFLVAETGSSVIVTNEGNGDLTQTLARVHIVLASIEKVIPTLNDLDVFLRLLARSATGQEQSVYTTLSTGPRRDEDPDGPEQYHVILLDNGRSKMLGTEFEDMLRCIRCGACINHCPVYHAVGGHAYGWVYPGPMGSVLTPSLVGIDKTGHLPNASTLCGRCESVCPMRIPLPKMLRHWRERDFARHLPTNPQRLGLKGWAFLASRPKLYHSVMRPGMKLMKYLAPMTGLMKRLPAASGWTRHREFPAPEGETFQQLWAKAQDKGGKQQGKAR